MAAFGLGACSDANPQSATHSLHTPNNSISNGSHHHRTPENSTSDGLRLHPSGARPDSTSFWGDETQRESMLEHIHLIDTPAFELR
ncbi:MAG: hypothetical protein AAFX99_18945 [Myxococcota bacterium]